jgi:hypothetical protein
VVNISLALAGMVVLRRIRAAHDPAHCFDAQGQGRHVQQQHIRCATAQNIGLYRRAQGDHFVRIQFAVRLFSEEGLHSLANQRHACRTADEDDFVDVAGR